MFFLGFNKIWTFLVHFGSLFFWSARRPFAVITDLILALSQICSFLDQNAAHFSSLVCMQVKFAVITDLAASTILYFTVSRGDAFYLYFKFSNCTSYKCFTYIAEIITNWLSCIYPGKYWTIWIYIWKMCDLV